MILKRRHNSHNSEEELIEKIERVLQETKVGSISIEGEHRYVVMTWETYREKYAPPTTEKITEASIVSGDEDVNEKEARQAQEQDSTSFDIMDIPI